MGVIRTKPVQYVLEEHTHTADEVTLSTLDTPTYGNLQDAADKTFSCGYAEGGVMSDGGSGTLNVTGGSGYIRSVNSGTSELIAFDFDAVTSLSLTDESTNYIYVDYNSGVPTIGAELVKTADGRTKFYLGKVFREDTGLQILQAGQNITEQLKRVQSRINGVFGEIQRASGMILGDGGALTLTLSAGKYFAGLTAHTTTARDTGGSDTFEYYYYNGASWVEVEDQTTIDNTYYNNTASGLVELSNNFFGVHWVYADVEGNLLVAYGQDEYLKLSDAESAQPPTINWGHIADVSILVGKVIVEKGATELSEVESAFTVNFSPAVVTNHSDLAGLLENDHTQYALGTTTIAAGTGLAGGGDISATRTLSVDMNSLAALGGTADGADYLVISDTSEGSSLKKVLVGNLPTAGGGEANTASNTGSGVGVYAAKAGIDLQFKSILTSSDRLTVTADSDEITIDVAEDQIDHDQLNNFTGDEHVDHTAVSISAGSGLSGGGDISASRTLSIDISSLGALGETANSADYLILSDSSDGDSVKKVLVSNLPTAGGGEANTASNTGSGVGVWAAKAGVDLQFKSITTASDKISVVSGSDNIQLDIVDSQIDHDSLNNTHNLTTDIDHDQLTNFSSGEHFTEASIDHANIQNIGTNTHGEIDDHIGSGDIHFTEGSIDHNSLANTHNLTTDIDHDQLTNFESNEHFTEASIDHTAIQNVGINTHGQLDAHVSSGDIHFTEASIDHINISNVGTNTHGQIDSHISDSDIHFTEASVDHLNISNVGVNTHGQIDSHIADSDIHFTEASIDHTNISNIGTNTHGQIDSHIGDSDIHFTEASISHDNIADVSADDHHSQQHGLADGDHTPTTLDGINSLISNATLDDSSGARTPTAHQSSHNDGGSDALSHDNLAAIPANDHIDHTSVTISAGSGLSGGGDISASRTINVDISPMGDIGNPDPGDVVLVEDVTDGSIKKLQVGNFPTGGGGEANTASNTGSGIGFYAAKAGVDLQFKTVLTSSDRLTITADADEVTMDVAESQIDHDNLTNTHNLTTDIDHTAISNIGTNTHGQLDDHVGSGDIHFTEASIDHTNISNVGVNTHGQVDSHIDDSDIHFTEASIDHLNISNIGTNTHGQIDDHIGSGDIHFTEASIDHLNISNIGTNTHGEIDSHIDDSSLHFTEASIDHSVINDDEAEKHRLINDSGSATTDLWSADKISTELGDKAEAVHSHSASAITAGTFDDGRIAESNVTQHVGAIDHDSLLNFESNEHFTEASIDHTNISNIGTNTHGQIDSHISDSDIHFNEASIDHTAISNIGTNTHGQIDDHIGSGDIHFTEASIDHTNISNVGTNTHGDIDDHIADSDIHFTEASIDHTSITNVGVNTHGQIDSHISDSDIHFTEASISHDNIADVSADDHHSQQHGLADGDHTPTTLDGINLLISNATLDDSGDPRDPNAHASSHNDGQSDAVDHDSLTNYVADEHVDHTGVSVAAGTGLSGGGTISATRTVSIDVDSLPALGTEAASGDYLILSDSDDSNQVKKVLVSNLPTAGEGEANTASNTGSGIGFYAAKAGVDLQFKTVLTSSDRLTVTADADEVTIDVAEGEIDHDQLTNTHNLTTDIDHTTISNIGTNTHGEIDSHIGSGDIHFTEASIDHVNISNVGTNTHGEIDSHIADSDIHFTEASIDHTAISNVGDNTHAQIDTHIATLTTLAGLNDLISDATLDDSSDARTPTAHDLGGGLHNADTLANLNSKISDATLYEWEDDQGGTQINAANVPDGADGSAVHDDEAGEINALTGKSTPVDADIILIEDSQTLFSKKKVALSDLSGGIKNVSEDTTPELGGDLNAGGYSATNFDSIAFGTEFDLGDSGASATVTWSDYQKQKLTLTDDCAITFVDPAGPANLVLRLVQDAGGTNTAGWTNVLWPNGEAPTLSTAGNAIDIVSFYYSGVSYFGMSATGFA